MKTAFLPRPTWPLVGLLLLSLAGASLAAPLFYRFEDAEGRLVISAQLPPEIVRKGYEIVDSYGRVVNKVAPALTAEQIIERDRLQAEKAAAAEAARIQSEQDAKLRRQFPRPEDAERAKNRRLEELNTLITFKKNAISRQETRIFDLEGEAAKRQKAGKPVPASITDAIAQQERQIEILHDEVAELEQNKTAVAAEYDEKISRLHTLLQ